MAPRPTGWITSTHPVARVAFLLATQRSPLASWRRAAIGACSFVLVVASGMVLSLWSAASLREEVARDRWPIVASAADAGARMLEYGPVVAGRQFPLYWIEPVGDDAPVPPGLERIPEPGTVALSPALYGALGADVEEQIGLAPATFNGRPALIDASGLASPDEFIAYARPPRDRDLSGSIRSVGVVGFGAEAPMTPLGLGYGADSPASVLLGGLALLAIPSLYLVWVSVGSGAQMRDARLATLFELGASRTTRRAVVFFEAAMQSLAGVVLGAALWYAALTRIPGIPVAGLSYFRGDLDVPAAWVVAVALTAPIVVGLLAVVQSSSGRLRVNAALGGRRLGLPRRIATVLRVGALGLTFALIGFAQTRPYPKSTQYWQLALLLAICSQPLVLPLYIDLLGRWARSRQRPTTWLAGRRMVHSPTQLARPAFALAGLVLVAVVGVSVMAVRSAASPSTPGVDPAIVSVSWVDATVDDVAALRRSLPSAAVMSLVELTDGSSQLSVPMCTDVLSVASETRCNGEIPPSITERVHAYRQNIGIMPTVTVDASIEQDVDAPVDDAIILGVANESGEDLYESVLPTANRVLGVTNLHGGRFIQVTQNAKRAAAGIAFGAGVTLLTALLLLGDRSILIAREDGALDMLGLPPEDQRRITFLEVALPSLASTMAGAAVGALFAYVGQDLDTKPETLFLWLPILLIVAVVALLALAVASCVSRVRPPKPQPDQNQ